MLLSKLFSFVLYFFMLGFLLFCGKTEISDLFTKRKVFAVSKGAKICLVEPQLSFLINKVLAHVDGNYIRKEHIV